MPSRKASKEKVIKAAIDLFNVQGYAGTSVRDIASKADANVALISYYFGSKQGLLEHLMTDFLEGFVESIERHIEHIDETGAGAVLLSAMWDVMAYQQRRHHLARFVHREITLDTILVRELMTTYLTKEKSLYKKIIKTGYEKGEFRHPPNDYWVLQFRGMLILPFLHPQYIREVYHLMPHEGHFLSRYYQEITRWLSPLFNGEIPRELKESPLG
ncbi:forespore capture DNA-binding protein RefZ [Alteribacter aurantiacus]|uniref:forespore capture DNA-binding protein RefZ n=1 Tax=Alteribacter aurantiacus TaxID=254410 RepID=UPI0003F94552|nr:forespore capture DNA-binding protein RefZ [Alteribacter aurantiacus]